MSTVCPGVPNMNLFCFPQNPRASASEGGDILVSPTLLRRTSLCRTPFDKAARSNIPF